MNLSETTFVAKAWNKNLKEDKDIFTIRWFSPVKESEWCGHATLAASRAVFDNFPLTSVIKFETKFIGIIEAKIDSKREIITLDFPLSHLISIDLKTNPLMKEIVGTVLNNKLSFDDVEDVQYGDDIKYLMICLRDDEHLISKVSPDFNQLLNKQTNDSSDLVIVTQRPKNRSDVHFYYRTFAPLFGTNEDPVCGSANAMLAPYWKRRYNESGIQVQKMVGKSCSKRGGFVFCEVVGQRVVFGGRTRTVVKGSAKI